METGSDFSLSGGPRLAGTFFSPEANVGRWTDPSQQPSPPRISPVMPEKDLGCRTGLESCAHPALYACHVTEPRWLVTYNITVMYFSWPLGSLLSILIWESYR